MGRHILPEAQIHPSIREKITSNHRDIVDEVRSAVGRDDVVVVGMAQNPYPKRARKALDAKKVTYTYLEYGSYLSTWRKRTALKMWTGWPTFPMIFVKGTLIGGAEDLEKLLASGEFDRLVAAERAKEGANGHQPRV